MSDNLHSESLHNWNKASVDIYDCITRGHGKLNPDDVRLLCETNNLNAGQLQRLLVTTAQSYSMAAMSNFQVGAVALGWDHDEHGYPSIYIGSNIELVSAGISYTIHAEQCVTAIASAHADKVSSLALNVTPCGMCRQLLHEYSNGAPIPIAVAAETAIDISLLLPQGFGPKDLDIRPYEVAERPDLFADSSAELEAVLTRAMSSAYAPFSGNAMSCVVTLEDRTMYPGFSLESAAYNPGLTALQVALCIIRLSKPSFKLEDLDSLVVLSQEDNPAQYREMEFLWHRLAPEKAIEFRITE